NADGATRGSTNPPFLGLPGDFHRRGAPGLGRVAELAVAVIAPTVGHLPCGEGARMVAAGTDEAEAERPEERDGPVAAGHAGSASPGLAGLWGVATQLTAVVGPPAIDRVPGGDPARVQRSGGQREEAVSSNDENVNG